MNLVILLAFTAAAIWIVRRDIAERPGLSRAVWIPTLWVAILASRPVSSWLGSQGLGGGYEYSLEGNPVDRVFFFGLIAAAFITLSRRRITWSALIFQNWPIFLFYGYFLFSVVWSDSPVPSFKRWFKDFGNIFVALVILTEANPSEAFRAVFVRCGYVLIPLSLIFIRYFPNLGRIYTVHSGQLEPTGVTFQKNSLGALVLVCGIVLIWDWLERSRPGVETRDRLGRYLVLAVGLIGAWLIRVSDSKTSIACLLLAGFILGAARLPVFRNRIGALGVYAFVGTAAFFALDWSFGISSLVVSSMGRDMSFTGRTDVWSALLALKTDPIIGTGFCSFWSNSIYRSQLPDWVAFSAHNGYLEMYLDGGWLGVGFLLLMLMVVGLRINRQLSSGGNFALARFAVFAATVIGDLSESHFARMSPLWFLFLAAALVVPAPNPSPAVPDPGSSRRALA